MPKQALRMKTSEFESKAYTGAESKEDYLRRIARGLPEVERQVIDQQKSSDENSSAEGTACDVEDIGSGGSSSASATSKKEDISVAYDTSPVDSTSSSQNGGVRSSSSWRDSISSEDRIMVCRQIFRKIHSKHIQFPFIYATVVKFSNKVYI